MYFRVTPPSVHQMIVTLEARGLISLIPWTPRTIQVLVPKEELPELD
jgi:Mn-dependent DtxR family transcriptional regulator